VIATTKCQFNNKEQGKDPTSNPEGEEELLESKTQQQDQFAFKAIVQEENLGNVCLCDQKRISQVGGRKSPKTQENHCS
jgi:hypothetical protein